MKEVPCIYADDLTEEQVKAFRLADNKTGELALWDFGALDQELSEVIDLDMEAFGFGHFDFGITRFFEGDEPVKKTFEEKEDESKKVTCPECGHEFEI